MNKVTVFEFVTEFNNFYNNVLELINDVSNNTSKVYTDIVYDMLTNYKNEIERTLETKVLSVEKSRNFLTKNMEHLVKIGNNCVDNYNLTNSEDSYTAYLFINSVIDCYNELIEDLEY